MGRYKHYRACSDRKTGNFFPAPASKLLYKFKGTILRAGSDSLTISTSTSIPDLSSDQRPVATANPVLFAAGPAECPATSLSARSADPLNIVVEAVELEDIERDETRPVPRYNTSNHWRFGEGGQRPEDYDDVEEAATARHWMTSLKPECQRFTIAPADVSVLLEFQTVYCLRFRLSHACIENIEDLASKRCYQPLREALGRGEFFVRSDYASLKYGKHGNKVYRSLADVFVSMVTSKRSHSPLGRSDQGAALSLYLIPWVKINPDLEFRVFVHQKNITAISQQCIYQKNEYLQGRNIPGLVQMISAYFRANIRDQVDTLDSYVMDMALIGDSVSTVYFIELNPFGKDYTSGAGAFSWVEDADKLCPHAPGTIYFRYVV